MNRYALQPIENGPANAECRLRIAPESLARRGTSAMGQGPAQPIVATKARGFNRSESAIPWRHEHDQVIGNWRAAAHIKMIQ
ncbi:conserved hypothetical protein [Burkholderia cenocepacia HI2424]|uniref:Uncharacterized protein n=2 Tax=Burkholderia cepacia complex TaxID=87882 RepID=A0A3R9C6I4_9BURK|nr:conserved hypothetical protein [Burkholderia cenocepacia HI2424]PNO73653.1 hypothetical protein DK10_022090 [Burkholderia cenocepacia]RSC03440.1 hypothetical protein EGT41_29390 [Burkholderia cenocepacia]